MIWLSLHCLCISRTAWSDYHHTVCAFLVLYDLIIITLSVHFSYCVIWLSSRCLCISRTVWSDYHHTVCAFLVLSSTVRLFHSKRFSFLLLKELSCVWSILISNRHSKTIIHTQFGTTGLFLLCLQHVLARLGHYEVVQYKANMCVYIYKWRTSSMPKCGAHV